MTHPEANPSASPATVNPYAPPAEASMPPVVLQPDLYYFRDGDFLVVRDGAELPPVCVRTNQPTTDDSWRRKVTLTWSPPWIFAFILISLLVVIIVMLVMQKKAKVTYSLCTAARAQIVMKRGIGFVLLLGSIGLFAAAVLWESHWDVVCGFGAVAVLILSLVFFVIANPVKVVKFRDGWFRVRGCSRDFLATLPLRPSPF